MYYSTTLLENYLNYEPKKKVRGYLSESFYITEDADKEKIKEAKKAYGIFKGIFIKTERIKDATPSKLAELFNATVKIDKLNGVKGIDQSKVDALISAIQKDINEVADNEKISSEKVKKYFDNDNITSTNVYKFFHEFYGDEDIAKKSAKSVGLIIMGKKEWDIKSLVITCACLVLGVAFIYLGVKFTTGESIFNNFSVTNLFKSIMDAIRRFWEKPLPVIMMLAGIASFCYGVYRIVRPLAIKIWQTIKGWFKKNDKVAKEIKEKVEEKVENKEPVKAEEINEIVNTEYKDVQVVSPSEAKSEPNSGKVDVKQVVTLVNTVLDSENFYSDKGFALDPSHPDYEKYNGIYEAKKRKRVKRRR